MISTPSETGLWVHGRIGRGGGGWGGSPPPPSTPPPSLLGKQSQSDNIRFTVEQYWLIIKVNGTNSVNPPPVDNNFGKFLRKIFFDNSGTIRKVGQISFRPPNFFFPVRPGVWVRGCRAVSKLVKTALIEHCYTVTVKLLKSKVTLNICEKLKMTQRDTGNIKSKVNETCCCETCHI